MVRPDKIIRSNRKTLSVCIDPFGQVTVRAPKRCSEERIFSFLQEKEKWILRTVSKIKGAGMRLPPDNLDGYRFLLLGKPCVITLIAEDKIGYDAETGMLYLPAERSRERLTAWLKENAKRIFTQVTAQKAKEMNAEYLSASVTSAKTRWGSCSYNNAVHYSFRLLYAPKEVVEYVVVHELAHTFHKNHSREFWREVEKYVPDWKSRRKWLKDHGILMQIF